MAWFKVDDKLHDHRKSRAAGTAAMGVWLLAGSWAADNLTDGFIPTTILPRWGRPRDASRLVSVGLWHADEQDGERGWRFHEWAERQPTRAQKLAERATKAEAGRAGGLRSGQSRREASVKHGATGQVELPSRPVPSPSFSEIADAIPEAQRDDIERVCAHLADSVEGRGVKRPEITKPWRTSARLLIDKDGYTEQQIVWLIDRTANDEFWRSNVLSMPKLRTQADQLKLKFRGDVLEPNPTDDQGRIVLPPLPPKNLY